MSNKLNYIHNVPMVGYVAIQNYGTNVVKYMNFFRSQSGVFYLLTTYEDRFKFKYDQLMGYQNNEVEMVEIPQLQFCVISSEFSSPVSMQELFYYNYLAVIGMEQKLEAFLDMLREEFADDKDYTYEENFRFENFKSE